MAMSRSCSASLMYASIRGRVFYVIARYFSRLLPERLDSRKLFLDLVWLIAAGTRAEAAEFNPADPTFQPVPAASSPKTAASLSSHGACVRASPPAGCRSPEA